MKNIINQSVLFYVVCIGALFSMIACESMLDVELDKGKITKDRVFSDDMVANSAMNGVYSGMFDRAGFASGSNNSVTASAGLLADELETYSSDPSVSEFAQNQLRPENSRILDLWFSMYKTIYSANAVVEGVAESSTLTDSTRLQLEGEAKFVRAFCYFYLVNFFGEVPLNLTTDYRANATAKRSSVTEIYQQISEDLDFAEEKLSSDFVAIDRVRPNSLAASALKARVALFTGKWSDAEERASRIIDDGKFGLVELDDVFKINSQEAIWQLQPVESFVTNEGSSFIIWMKPFGFNFNGLRTDFLMSFEAGDARRDHWVSSYSEEGNTWYYPFKYKVQSSTIFANEASTVLRVAEQYLIRAEARLRTGNITGAMADIDVIRSRADLPLVSTAGIEVSTDSLFSLIQHERRIEMFTEWGHRWLDLKRLEELNSIIGGIKPSWNDGDELLPIPQVERIRNPFLGEQNHGYL